MDSDGALQNASECESRLPFGRLDVYSDVSEGDERTALAKLPALPEAVQDGETKQGTGTDG